MVLPGIEEEDENGHRLSLTSLLLGQKSIKLRLSLARLEFCCHPF